MKVFVSWSGGKESSFSCYRIMKDKDVKVMYLLNMVSEDGKHSSSHGVSSNLLRLQGEAVGIPIIQPKATWDTYEGVFKKTLLDLKNKGVDTGIFGDIDLQVHRDWVERVCKDIGIRPILPLWKGKREELITEFIQAGFKAMVVSTQTKFLDTKWLGREINEGFIQELKSLGNIDLCGEGGEYHSFVYDGPIFKKCVRFSIGEKTTRDKHHFLELIPKK